MSPTEQLKILGIELPALVAPSGSYLHAVKTGNLLFLAGKGAGEYRGKVGRQVTLLEAQEFARSTTLMLLAVLRQELGSLDRVVRFVKIVGFINATEDFADHPRVMNGCSDLLVEIFGERGCHARTSIGVASTPDQIPIEIEAIVEFAE